MCAREARAALVVVRAVRRFTAGFATDLVRDLDAARVARAFVEPAFVVLALDAPAVAGRAFTERGFATRGFTARGLEARTVELLFAFAVARFVVTPVFLFALPFAVVELALDFVVFPAPFVAAATLFAPRFNADPSNDILLRVREGFFSAPGLSDRDP